MRVTLLHIAVDGNSEIPRALRQECDDIVEINAAQLRPYAELISGAEPPRHGRAGRRAHCSRSARWLERPRPAAGTAPNRQPRRKPTTATRRSPGSSAGRNDRAWRLSRRTSSRSSRTPSLASSRSAAAWSAAAWSASGRSREHAACPGKRWPLEQDQPAAPAERPPSGTRRRASARVRSAPVVPAGAAVRTAFAVRPRTARSMPCSPDWPAGPEFTPARGVRRPGGRSRAAAGSRSLFRRLRNRATEPVRVPPRCHPHAAATRSGEPGAAASRAR